VRVAVNISEFDNRLQLCVWRRRDAAAWRGQERGYGVGRGAGANPGV